jgi:hypothetical protein
MRPTHPERCRDCKRRVESLLTRIYGHVEMNWSFNLSARLDDYASSGAYGSLRDIHFQLQCNRGHADFVRAKKLPPCDFWVRDPGFVVEFDESQHFTVPRRLSLQRYPSTLPLGFSISRWISLCDRIQAADNDPPFRDEQRAWYDTLRDFLPVTRGLRPTVRLYAKDAQWCGMELENKGDVERFSSLLEANLSSSIGGVGTVIVSSTRRLTKEDRLFELNEITNLALQKKPTLGVLVFPGGWFNAGAERPVELLDWAEREIRAMLDKSAGNLTICVGVDGRIGKYPRDQYAIAIDKGGIKAIGRKFHPAPEERGFVDLACSYMETEMGRSRIFEANGHRVYLCACYDSFGIKQKALPNPGVEAVVDLVHGFHPIGQPGSGDVYFAKHGFASAAKQWGCAVFGAAVFFNREIPEDWPSGVIWKSSNRSTKQWRYSDNGLRPNLKATVPIPEGIAQIRFFDLAGPSSS